MSVGAASERADVPRSEKQRPGGEFLRLEPRGHLYAGLNGGALPRRRARRFHQNLRLEIGVCR